MTVTFHNGSAAHREHNIRKPTVVSKQEHIHPELSSNNIVFVDVPPREAYASLFGDALRAYNAKQKRPERKIADYFNHISDNPQKHTVYECILQIGNRDDHPPLEDERNILTQYFRSWTERNPNLFVCGAYLHADEDGGTHLHIDYIPFADGYKNGLSRQTGLVRAFGQQGIVGTSATLTAQILWERRERQTLAELCTEQGISVASTVGGRKHADTPEYKAKMAALEEINTAISEQEEARTTTAAELEAAAAERQRLASEAGDYLVHNLRLNQENEEFEKALELRRKALGHDVAAVAQPVPIPLRLTHGDSVLVKKKDWEDVAALARNEAASATLLKAEKKKRIAAESDRDRWQSEVRQQVEPLRLAAHKFRDENTELKETISELREERRGLIALVNSITAYLREHASAAIFEAVDRLVDKLRSPERKKSHDP